MAKRTEMVCKLHDEGMTYEQIGNILGISKQRVQQIYKDSNTPRDNLHEGAICKIPYVGLRNWMLENRVTLTRLSEMCGKSGVSHLTNGTEPRKSTIDAILSVTGMTYEECFKEED